MELIALLLWQLCGTDRAAGYAEHIERAADRYLVDPRVLVSQIVQESSCQEGAVGRLGEQGLMQLKRHTVATRGYDRLTDEQLRAPALNIMLGARHLRWCLDKCARGEPAMSYEGALSVYKGVRMKKNKRAQVRACRSTSYARGILARIGNS